MQGKKDKVVWDEFERTNDGIIRCKHCTKEFSKKTAVKRLRNHLLGIENCGITSCLKVPECVKHALADASTSSKRPRIEPPSSINNNEFNNDGDDRQPIQEELQCVQEEHERSDTSALARWDNTSVPCDMMAKRDACMIEPGPSIDEVNNRASTSAPQQNNEVQNGMQADHEVVQGTDEECFVIVPETRNEVLEPVSEWIHNNETLNEDIQVLTRKVERLSSRAEDINIIIDSLKSQSGKKRKREVENWLRNVQRMKNEVEQIKNEVQESSCLMPASVRRRVEKHIQEAAELVEQGSFPDGIVLRDANQSKGEELITVPLVGETTAKRNLEKIWGCLMNEDALSIGIYGMGGVGKTTIITHIHNRLLKVDSSFDNVYWVTVSQQSSIFKLQGDISEAVKLDLSMERDERKRAAKLFHKLERCKKFVLILDDMWEKFPVENVGVPLRVNGGKLLLTTRSFKVCKEMKCKEIIKVEPLSGIESWKLFLNLIGPNNVCSPLMEGIAKLMAKECAGLPLAIVVVANSMRGLEEYYEWRDALYKLKEHSKGLNEMENEVFIPLKFSYDRLGDEKLQQCFLYCSLFPEDHVIKRNDLIAYWIGEELIDELESRMATFDRGNAMINRLINACLLERADVCSVKMHDVIRDMALAVARVNPMFMVKAGVHLRDFPGEREWLVNLDRVSLMNGFFLEGCSHNLSPNCPRLKTLFLQGNYHLRRVPNCFFVNMQSLNVLDLSNTCIEQLPDSLSNMGKLRVLLLRGCRFLKRIPSLAKFENLQELDLSSCGVEELPNGIERLVNLRVLNLSRTPIQGLIPSEVLRKLSHLQTLRLWKCGVEVLPEALASLGELEILEVKFSEIHSFSSCVRTQNWQRLSQYSISTGFNFNDVKFPLYDFVELKGIVEHRGVIRNQRDHFCLPNDVMCLDIGGCSNGTSLVGDHGVDVNNLPMFTVCGGIFDNLKELYIDECHQLKHLVSSSLAQQLFQNLTVLRVWDCENLVELIVAEDESFNQSSSSSSCHNDIVLPKLQELYLNLEGLPKLKSIYIGTMVCHSLRKIEVWGCPMLKKLPFSMQQDEQHTSPEIYGERE